MAKMKTPIDPLYEKCKKAINNEIAKEFRNEAKEIMLLTTEKHRKDFIMYHEQDSGNICCLVLDAAKQDLIKEGKLVLNEGDGFGKPFML